MLKSRSCRSSSVGARAHLIVSPSPLPPSPISLSLTHSLTLCVSFFLSSLVNALKLHGFQWHSLNYLCCEHSLRSMTKYGQVMSFPIQKQSVEGGRGRGWNLRTEEADADSCLQHAQSRVSVKSCGADKSVHALAWSDQVMRLRPLLQPPSTVPCMAVLHKPSCRTTWPNHASFPGFTVGPPLWPSA